MIENKLVELVSRIEKKTISDSLTWEPTADAHEFQTTLGNFVVRIGEQFDPSDVDNPDYVIRIIDNMGNVLESATNGELFKITPEGKIENRHPYEVMKSIFRKAKRQALGVDKAIDSILSELE